MKADDAQRMVVRALVEAGAEPRAAPQTGETTETADTTLTEKLELFGGFIARIKHAQLRRTFPLTLRLLAIHRADIAFFTGIAADFQARRSRGPIPQDELVVRFSRQLRGWLPQAPGDVRQPIGAMLRHEQSMWDVAQEAAETDAKEGGSEGDGDDHPSLVRCVAVGCYDCDVLTVARALRNEPFAAPPCEPRELYLLYSAGDGAVRINEIDPLSAWLLSRLDGHTPIAQLAAQWPERTDDFERIVRELVEDGRKRGLVTAAAVQVNA